MVKEGGRGMRLTITCTTFHTEDMSYMQNCQVTVTHVMTEANDEEMKKG